MTDPASLKAYVTGNLAAKQATTIQKVPVPRFGGRLTLRCRTLADRDLLRLSVDAEESPDRVEGLIQAAVTSLLQSCEGCETEIDGETVDLDKRLGLELSQYLGEEAGCGSAHTDREAVLEVFGGEVDIVETATKLQQIQALGNAEIAGETVGNSEAAR